VKSILKFLSYLGLAFTAIPAVLVFTGTISLQTQHNLLVVGMLLWFGTAIFWVKREKTGG